jgi:riboflavin kinase/FMN adenylyltransferase
MRIVRDLSGVTLDKNSVATVGTFDGVHLAHQEIIREVVNRARMREGRSVVITFDPHPKEVVASSKGGEVRLLTTMEERIALFERLRIDLLFSVPFTLEFSRLRPREFYERYVVNGVGVSEVVVGYDHMFGRDREAGIGELVKIGQEFDFSVFAVHPFTIEGETVSSSRIRRALASGDLLRAEKMLGYPYRLSGRVVRGDGRGKMMGFPTANISPDSLRKIVPARGVYVVAADVRGRRQYGMMNVGVRPTVTAGVAETVEVHLFDFSEELYGDTVTVTFLRRLRDERRFANVEELVRQLGQDKEDSLRILAEHRKQDIQVQ